jgi:hypothetical protein
MATNDEIIAKLPLALVELRKQNKDAATKAAEDRAKEFEVATASRDALEKGSDERKAMNSELSKMRNQDDRKEAREKAAASSTAGQAIKLKEELESQGKVAEDNKEFQKLSYQARKEDYAQRLADATSPAAKKEIREERRADAKKNGSKLDKIGAGIGGLWEMGKKGLKTAALGGMALLSTLAIGGLMIALGKFLQSDTFKDMTKYIQDTVIPKLKEFGASLKNGMQKLITLFSGTDKDGNPVSMFERITGVLNKDSALVVGLMSIVAMFGAAKLLKLFGPLKGAIGKMLSGIGGLAKKIPGIPGGGKAGAASSIATKAGRAGGGGGLGKSIGSVGKGIGQGIGGVLRGIAGGLAAIAAPPVLVGLAAVSVAILAISAAIRIMRPAFEPIGKMFESFGKTVKTVFEGLGVIIKDIGESISKIITAIGDSIGKIIDKITSMKTAGTDATTKQIKELSAIPGNLMLETAKGIDAIKKALDGFGGGTFSQIAGSLFGGSGPIEKIIKLSEKVPALMKASEAIAVLGAAGQDFAKAEAELERRKKVSKLKKRLSTSYTFSSDKKEDQAELKSLEGQAMPISAGGGSNFSAQSKNMITAAINAADITLIEKERMKREAEFKTAGLTTTGQQVFNQDNRQTSSVTTTGSSGQSPIRNNKFVNLNKSAEAAGF